MTTTAMMGPLFPFAKKSIEDYLTLSLLVGLFWTVIFPGPAAPSCWRLFAG